MRRTCLSVSALLVAIVPALAPADEWPGFLGAHRDGISQETGLIDAIPADGPQPIWRVPGGVGMSAVAVADGLAITTWKHHQINVVKKAWLYLIAGKQLDLGQRRQSGDNPVDRIDRTRGMVYKNSNGFLHAGRLSRAAFCYHAATHSRWVATSKPHQTGI